MQKIKDEKSHLNYKKYISQGLDLSSTLKSYPGKQLYACNICQKSFSNMTDHVNHLKTHSAEKPFICEHCKMAFSECTGLEKHIDIHTEHYPLSEKPFPCEVCPKSFKTHAQLRRHLTVHSDIKPFPCDICNMTFGYKKSLVDHLKIHDNESMENDTCLSTSITQGNGKQELVENDVKFFSDISQKYFNFEADSLQRESVNYKKNHPKAVDRSIKLESKISVKVKKHARKNKGKCYLCEFCQKIFSRKDYFIDHLRMHSGLIKPYVCDCCKAGFTRETNLIEHLKYHAKERAYECSYCIKAYKNKRDLIKHEKNHLKK